MDITDFDNTKNMNNDEWTFLLFLLFMQDLQNRNETWERFENDLIYKNRFTSDSPIVEELKKRSEQATRLIPNKSIFYRARSFKHSSFDKLLRYYMRENGCTKEEINSVLSNLSETEKHLSLLPQLYSDVDPNYLENNEETVYSCNGSYDGSRHDDRMFLQAAGDYRSSNRGRDHSRGDNHSRDRS